MGWHTRAGGGGGGWTRIYAAGKAATATGWDTTDSPMEGADSTIILPSRPRNIWVRLHWVVKDPNEQLNFTSGFSDGVYLDKNSLITVIWSNSYWYVWEEIETRDGSDEPFSVGLVARNNRFDDSFILTYAQSTGTLAWHPVNNPASMWVPAVNGIVVAGA